MILISKKDKSKFDWSNFVKVEEEKVFMSDIVVTSENFDYLLAYDILDNVCIINFFETKDKGKGYGTQVYQEFEDYLKEIGIKTVKLFSTMASVEFWKRNGFSSSLQIKNPQWLVKTL